MDFFSVFYVFIIIPLLDLIFGETKENLSDEDISYIKNKWIFDLMLYLNLPIVFGLLYLILFNINSNVYEVYELVGLAISSGILLATNGINVAHELGHRKSFFDRFLSQTFYIPCLYMHFFIEHNYGHHLKVATVYSLFSLEVTLFAIVIGIIAFLFLECINYIEHYGLRRFKNKSGKYERVQLHHSWNSNFNLGRITLYELTRHSDHHYKSSKKYQTLKSYDDSPLPLGYPASILLRFYST